MPRHSGRVRLAVDVVARAADRTATRGLSGWLAATAPSRLHGTVAVALLDDRAVRALNLRYRGVDAATDVLSFPAREPASRRARAASPAAGPVDGAPLGEIAIARGMAARQARAAGHALATELRILALHGLLHLAGYDHERDGGEMARVEARLRKKGGLRAGLIERAGSALMRPTAVSRRA